MKTTRRAMIVASGLGCLSTWRPLGALAAPPSFRGKDIGGKNFSGQNLAGADFSDSSLGEADFTRANLRGANFRGANVKFTRFGWAILANADLRDIIGPFLDGGTDTDYTGVNMEGVDLKGTTFYSANFSGANLRDTNGWGSIAMCHFENADVRGANFRSAWVPGVNPRAAVNSWPKFAGALYDKTTAWPSWYDVEESGTRLAQ